MSDAMHLTEHQISASVDGVLQGASQEQVVRHLADCAECRARYEELVGHHQMLATLLAHQADDAFFAALESDVERALGAGDALPRGAVVSVKGGPSKPASGAAPRPTLEAALESLGPRPAWAPPRPAARPGGEAEAGPFETIEAPAPAAPAAAGPPPRPAAPAASGAPPRSVTPVPEPAPSFPPRAAGSAPGPVHVFPDELFEDESDEPRTPAATPRRSGNPTAVLSYALGAVAVIAVGTLGVMLLRRSDEARPTAKPERPVATSPSADTPAAGEGEALPPSAVVAIPPGARPATITRIAPPASPAPRASAPPRPAETTARSEPEPAAARETPRPRATPRPPSREPAPVVPAPAPAAMAPTTRLVTGTARPANAPVRVCGVVRDADGGALPRAQVLVSGLTLGAIANESGGFCLNLPPGAHELRVSALGHAVTVQAVTVSAGMDAVTIVLRPAE